MARKIPVELDLDRDFVLQPPYNFTLEEVKLERGTENDDPYSLLQWLCMNDVEEGLPRIFLSAVILQQIHPDASFGACLSTAIIWERG